MKKSRDRIYDRELHLSALFIITTCFHRLSNKVTRPYLAPTPVGMMVRYAERTIEQAIILKLARQTSGIKALQLLLDAGMLQEQGAIQRILDDIGEDIVFLSTARLADNVTDLHKQYLEEFWREPFDNADPTKSTLDYGAVPRKKIRAQVSQFLSQEDPSSMVLNSKAMQKGYSGFVHAGSAHIMDMYSLEHKNFQVEGVKMQKIVASAQQDAWNYFYRGLVNTAIASAALGDDDCFRDLRDFSKEFFAGDN